MKILIMGDVPPPPRPWWHGQEMQCKECNTTIELEDDDDVFIYTMDRPHGKGVVRVECPLCWSYIEGDESAMRRAAKG